MRGRTWILVVVALVAVTTSGCTGGDGGMDASDGPHPDANPDAGARCGPANCEGCCDDDGSCRLGQSDEVCGGAGAACQNCGEAECRAGQCVAPACGDGVLDEGEQCDGAMLGGQTCGGLGFAGGTLGCSPTCAWDTAPCQLYTCDDDPAPCEVCSTDGSATIQCAGNCWLEQSTESCGAGTLCHAWEDPGSGDVHAACLAEAPATCLPNTPGICDGDVSVRCVSEGRLAEEDCAAQGLACHEVTDPLSGQPTSLCASADAEPCNESSFQEHCEGDGVRVCNWVGLTIINPCAEPFEEPRTCFEGTAGPQCLPADTPTCEVEGTSCSPDGRVVSCQATADPSLLIEVTVNDCGASGNTCAVTALGPECVQPNTVACDPQTHQPTCDGDFIRGCKATSNWEQLSATCANQGLTCHELDGLGPVCGPENYLPCDTQTDEPSCTGSAGQWCRAFSGLDPQNRGWWSEVTCTAPNPECVAAEPIACVASPPTACEPPVGSSPDDGLPGGAVATSCDGDEVVGCHSIEGLEVRFDCAAAFGPGAACAPPTGEGCLADPCWCWWD